MIIIGLTDIHGHLSPMHHLKSILDQADVVLIVGDITNFGKGPEADAVIAKIASQTGRIFGVSGNCDFHDVDEYLSQKGINLHGKGEVVDGIGFIGLGGSLITPFKTPNEYSEEEIEEALRKGMAYFSEKMPLVLVSHQPPLNTNCDKISSGTHVGSLSVRKFIEEHHPVLCFTGHIHESAGIDKIGKTHIINPGLFGKGSYAYAEIKNGSVKSEVRRIQ